MFEHPSGHAPRLVASAAIAVVTVTLSAAFTPRGAAAQSSAPASRLVLGEVYREAREASPRAAAARALARAAATRVSSAKRPPDPQLGLGFMNYELPSLEPMDPLGMTQLQLTQMVPTAGKRGLAGRVAEAQASAASARAADVAWEVRADVAMAFYELYRIDASLAVERETLRLLQDIASTADAMYRVGEGRQADVLRAQVEIARMTEDTLRLETMRAGMAARLNALLDRPPHSDVPQPAIPFFPAAIPAFDSLQQLARDERPMIAAGERELEAARAGERLARREIWPDLEVGVQYGWRAGEMGTERMGSLMLGATLPIFARSRQLRMREEAAAMREMAAADLSVMIAETRGRLAAAHADLGRSRRLATLYRTTIIPQAEAAVASALAAYRVGTVDFMTLLDNQMAVNEYRQALSTLDAEEGRAWSELEMLTGRELFDPNSVAATAGGAR